MSYDTGIVFESKLENNKNQAKQAAVLGLAGNWPITSVDAIQSAKLYTGTLVLELPARLGNIALDATFFKSKQDHVLKAIDVWYTGKEDESHRLLDSSTGSVGIYVSNQKEGNVWRERLFLVVKDFCASVSDKIKRELKAAVENNESILKRHKLELIDVTEKTLTFTRLLPEKQKQIQSELITWNRWADSIKEHQSDAKSHLRKVASQVLSLLKLNVGPIDDRCHVQWENYFRVNANAGILLYASGSPIIDQRTHAVVVRNAPLEGFTVFACSDKTVSRQEKKVYTSDDDWLAEYTDVDVGVDMSEYFGTRGVEHVDSSTLHRVEKDHAFYQSVIKGYDRESFEKTLSAMNESERDVFYQMLHDFSRMNMLEGWDKPLMIKDDATTSGDCRVPGVHIASKIPDPTYAEIFNPTMPEDHFAIDRLKAMKRSRETLRNVTRSMKLSDLKFFPTDMMDLQEWKRLKSSVAESVPFMAKVTKLTNVGERRLFYGKKNRFVLVNGSLVLVTRIMGAVPCAALQEKAWLSLEEDVDDDSYAELSKFAQTRKSDNKLMAKLRPLVLFFGA